MGLSESRIFGCPTRKSAGKDQFSEKPVGKGFAEPVPVRNTQPKPKRTAKNFEHTTLNSAAEEFRPPVGLLYPSPEDIPAVNFGRGGAPDLDPNEPEWSQFLAKKAYEKKVQNQPGSRPQRGPPGQRNIASSGPPAEKPAEKGTFQLQTSEYLKLLKAGEQKAGADSKKKQVPTGSTTAMGNGSAEHSMASLKNDLAGALDSIIRQQRAGQTDLQGLKNKKKPQVPLKKLMMQDKGGSKEDALLRIAQMLDIQEQEEGLAEAEGISAKDDQFIEQQNRDEDLAELAYWSDDDKAPRAIHRASAHKVGHLQKFKGAVARDYVTQQLGSDLDRNIAMMLLHLRRLNDRHRSFEPETPPRRRFVVGIKEVFRGVRHGRVKCIIVAPDIEEMTSAGGLDEKVKDILRVGYEQDVPVIFALSRVRIGRALGKSLRMSVLAVLDTTGVQDLYDSTIELAFQKRVAWLNQQPKLPPPEAMKEEPKGKSTSKAREVKGAKDRAGGNNQFQRRQDQNTPPGTWLPKQN